MSFFRPIMASCLVSARYVYWTRPFHNHNDTNSWICQCLLTAFGSVPTMVDLLDIEWKLPSKLKPLNLVAKKRSDFSSPQLSRAKLTLSSTCFCATSTSTELPSSQYHCYVRAKRGTVHCLMSTSMLLFSMVFVQYFYCVAISPH